MARVQGRIGTDLAPLRVYVRVGVANKGCMSSIAACNRKLLSAHNKVFHCGVGKMGKMLVFIR